MLMKNKNTNLILVPYLLFVFLCGLHFSTAAQDLSSSYSLGYGDEVSIKVFGENDLSLQTRVNDLGVISFPFLGDIEVLELTISEVQDKIENGLRDGYLVDPEVSVEVVAYRRFYVGGEVKSPGGFIFLPGLTIRKAINLAGGFTPRAAKNKIYIISDNDPDNLQQPVELSSPVKPGDVITVKQRFF